MKSLNGRYKWFALIIPLSIFLCGFQVKKADTVAVNGVVEKIDKGASFIVVNEVKLFLSRDMIIMDENGNLLKPDSIKPKAHLSVETQCRPEGYVIKKIIVKTTGK